MKQYYLDTSVLLVYTLASGNGKSDNILKNKDRRRDYPMFDRNVVKYDEPSDPCTYN